MDWAAGEEPTATKLNRILQGRCHAYQITTQSLANMTWSVITFTAEAYDPWGFHSTSVNTSRITPVFAGTYKVLGQVAYAPNTAGDRAAQVRKNGLTVDSMPYGPAPALNGAGFASGVAMCFGTVSVNGTTDYLELYANQNSGGSLNTSYGSGNTNSFLIVERIGD